MNMIKKIVALIVVIVITADVAYRIAKRKEAGNV